MIPLPRFMAYLLSSFIYLVTYFVKCQTSIESLFPLWVELHLQLPGEMFWSMRPSLCTKRGITSGVFLLLDRCSHPREGSLLHCYFMAYHGWLSCYKDLSRVVFS